MSNMSYCRFRNTATDLQDCVDALEEISVGDAEALSQEELEAAKRLASTALEMLRLIAEKADIDIDSEDGMDALEQGLDKALDFLNQEGHSRAP